MLKLCRKLRDLRIFLGSQGSRAKSESSTVMSHSIPKHSVFLECVEQFEVVVSFVKIELA